MKKELENILKNTKEYLLEKQDVLELALEKELFKAIESIASFLEIPKSVYKDKLPTVKKYEKSCFQQDLNRICLSSSNPIAVYEEAGHYLHDKVLPIYQDYNIFAIGSPMAVNEYLYCSLVETFGYFSSLLSGKDRCNLLDDWLEYAFTNKISKNEEICLQNTVNILDILKDDKIDKVDSLVNLIYETYLFGNKKDIDNIFLIKSFHIIGYDLGEMLFKHYIFNPEEAQNMCWEILNMDKNNSCDIYNKLYNQLSRNCS